MTADFVMTIALLEKLKLLTHKEATNLFKELQYKNLSMGYDECVTIIEDAFKKHSIGIKPVVTQLEVGGKTINVTK
jgi:hypothetical protein